MYLYVSYVSQIHLYAFLWIRNNTYKIHHRYIRDTAHINLCKSAFTKTVQFVSVCICMYMYACLSGGYPAFDDISFIFFMTSMCRRRPRRVWMNLSSIVIRCFNEPPPSHVSEVLESGLASGVFWAIGALVHSDDSVGPVTTMKKKIKTRLLQIKTIWSCGQWGACGGSRAIVTAVAGLHNTSRSHLSQSNSVDWSVLQSWMRRPLYFSTSHIPSDLSQAKEGATTHSSLVPITPAVADEQKLLLPKLQKKIHKTDHAPSTSRPPFRSSKVIPVNS
jgi:hypothetical protein